MNIVKPLNNANSVEKIISHISQISSKYEIMIRIGIQTGLRISDILKLKVKQLPPIGEETMIKETKTGKKRPISFTTEMHDMIETHVKQFKLKPDDYIVFSTIHHKNKPLSRTQAYNTIRQCATNLGITGIGTHSLRKTYAVEHFKKHRDIELLQRELNHKYLSTTISYLFDIKNINNIEL